MKNKITLFVFMLALPLFAAQDAEQKIQSLCDSLVLQFPNSIAAPRLAVLPFADNTGRSQGQGVAECLVARLQKGKRFLLVDRMEFRKAMSEIDLSYMDFTDSASALKTGRILSAPYLLTGNIADVFGTCRITAKIIRTETSEIMASASINTAPAALTELTKELLGEKGKITSSLFRSMVVPGWGQFYTDHSVRGGISLAAFAGAAGYLGYSIYSASQKKKEWKNFADWMGTDDWTANVNERYKTNPLAGANDSAKADSLYGIYSNKFDKAVVAGIVTGGVWVLNLLDAAIAGNQEKNKIKLYFSATPERVYGMSVVMCFK